MPNDHPHLTLVDPNSTADLDAEFIPLPHYPWDERPPNLALDPDECATALHICKGDIHNAAALLRIPAHKLNREILRHPRLTRVIQEALSLVVSRASSEYIRALDDPGDRRREWGAQNIMRSRAAASHPLAPNPPGSSASLTLTSQTGDRRLTFRWRTDADDALPDTPPDDAA